MLLLLAMCLLVLAHGTRAALARLSAIDQRLLILCAIAEAESQRELARVERSQAFLKSTPGRELLRKRLAHHAARQD